MDCRCTKHACLQLAKDAQGSMEVASQELERNTAALKRSHAEEVRSCSSLNLWLAPSDLEAGSFCRPDISLRTSELT